MQKLQKSAYKYKIRNAAEACFEIPTNYKLIISRLNKILHSTDNVELFLDINLGLRNIILKRLGIIRKQIYSNDIFNKSMYRNKIISPSDFGFHNMISQKDKQHFIAFENAGWNNPYKLFYYFKLIFIR